MKLWTWSHLLKKFLIGNFIFSAVNLIQFLPFQSVYPFQKTSQIQNGN